MRVRRKRKGKKSIIKEKFEVLCKVINNVIDDKLEKVVVVSDCLFVVW